MNLKFLIIITICIPLQEFLENKYNCMGPMGNNASVTSSLTSTCLLYKIARNHVGEYVIYS